MTVVAGPRRFPLARPATAGLLGGVGGLLAAVEPAHASLWLSGGQP